MQRIVLWHTLWAVVVAFAYLTPKTGSAEVAGHQTLDGRYAVVATEIYATSDPDPDSRRKPLIVLIDTWTGRAWSLSEDRKWTAIPYGLANGVFTPPKQVPSRSIK